LNWAPNGPPLRPHSQNCSAVTGLPPNWSWPTTTNPRAVVQAEGAFTLDELIPPCLTPEFGSTSPDARFFFFGYPFDCRKLKNSAVEFSGRATARMSRIPRATVFAHADRRFSLEFGSLQACLALLRADLEGVEASAGSSGPAQRCRRTSAGGGAESNHPAIPLASSAPGPVGGPAAAHSRRAGQSRPGEKAARHRM